MVSKLPFILSFVIEAGLATEQLLFRRRRYSVNPAMDFEVAGGAENLTAFGTSVTFVVGSVSSGNVLRQTGFAQKQTADVTRHLDRGF